MLFPELKLCGVCDVETSGSLSIKEIACVFDLATGEMEIQFDSSTSLGADDQSGDDSPILKNLKLQTPLGIATAGIVEDTLVKSKTTGGWWNGTTSLSYLFEEKNKHIPKTTLVFNLPIVLSWPCKTSEIIVTPGIDLYGEVEIKGVCRINGRKETLSILDFQGKEKRHILTSVSLAIGAPVRILAETQNQKLTLYPNKLRNDLQVHPIFFSGYPWKTMDLMHSGLVDVVSKAITHIGTLNKASQTGFINAVDSFLEGKSISVGLPIKLLVAIHFLEWFDDSKTFSKNQLVKRLGITQGDAAALVELRNGLIHNRTDLGEVFTDVIAKLSAEDSERFKKMRKLHPNGMLLNYLYSVCSSALLSEIGYEGLAQDYFPTEKDT